MLKSPFVARSLFFLAIAAAVWNFLLLGSQENSLALAVSGKIDYYTAWAYRFRDANLFTHNGPTPYTLYLISPLGVIGYLSILVTLIFPLLVRTRPRVLTFVSAVAILLLALPLFNIASPMLALNRQRAMGPSGFADAILRKHHGEKIRLAESCHAVVNPSDLRAINSLELIARESLENFSHIAILDLKIVENNYRLLDLKDAKGKPVFSDAARAFAKAELDYAQKRQTELIDVPKLCLIANFENLPDLETPPYSRAHALITARRAKGRETRIIQLPAGYP